MNVSCNTSLVFLYGLKTIQPPKMVLLTTGTTTDYKLKT